MKPLFGHWADVEGALQAARDWIFLFDLDGTLAPIRLHPERVRLPIETRRGLRALSRMPRCIVGVVSGRRMSDVRRRVGLPGLLYIGNHGFEIVDKGNRFVHPSVRANARVLNALARGVEHRIARIPGAWVEDKGSTFSVHFRQTPSRRIGEVSRIVRHAVLACDSRAVMDVRPGKKVIEVRPDRRWNKGAAVTRIRRLRAPGTRVFYVGDDLTDEDVFKTLLPGDVSVRVARSAASRARFYVRNAQDVRRVVRRLARTVAKRGRYGQAAG